MGLISKHVKEVQEFEHAYLRIQNVHTSNADYEKFEVVKDSSSGEEYEKLVWESKIESQATVFVWPDAGARQNRAYPIDWFSIEFQYNLSEHSNIFEQAYSALAEHQKSKHGQDVLLEGV
jgi:hypothetical protein